VLYRVVQDGHLYGGPLVRQAITSGSGLSPSEPFDPAGAETVISATTGSFVAWQRPGSRDLQLTGFGAKKVFRNEGLCLLAVNLSAVSSTVRGYGGAIEV
jgi:hypothetical protein